MQTFLARFAILLIVTLASTSIWLIDPGKSRVQFKMHPLLVSSMGGVFHKFNGMAMLDDKDITRSRIKVNIDTSSIDTGTSKLDEELRSDSFLNVTRYPTMTFESKKITRDGPDNLKVAGNLKLHGVTRVVVLDVKRPGTATKDRYGKMRRTVSAAARISRKDFGLTLNPVLGAGLHDEIDIDMDVELVRK
ncbi:MAG TPA: YceI family protein [Geobacteraceae bacterium]|nr:YceI family protein [Geobacteraceae bacterium]